MCNTLVQSVYFVTFWSKVSYRQYFIRSHMVTRHRKRRLFIERNVRCGPLENDTIEMEDTADKNTGKARVREFGKLLNEIFRQ